MTLGTTEQPWRVVMIDDAADLRMLVRLVLERTGRFTVVGEAGDGRAGIELARELLPDLILLDVAMPILDGLTALPLLQSACPNARIIMLSGFASDPIAERALNDGAIGYLEKGLSPTALVAEVAALAGTDGRALAQFDDGSEG